MLRKLNTWYTIADGNWSNPNIWLSNAKRKHTIPQPGDNVYVNNNVTLDGNVSVNNLYGNGKLMFGDSIHTLTIVNILNISGTIDMSNSPHQLNLYGINNYVSNFICGVLATVNYLSTYEYQPVMPLTYCNLFIGSVGTNQLTGTTVINGNLTLNGNATFGKGGILELSTYNITVHGNTILNQPSLISKNSNIGNTLFVGSVTANGGDAKRFDLSVGNPDIEFRGGLTLNQNSQQSNLGTGTMKFTTNNQNIVGSNLFQFGANILIDSGVTLNITGNGICCYGIINGVDETSILNNNSTLLLSNNTMPMEIGLFNYKNATGSLLGFTMNDNCTIPFTSFNNLSIAGTGIKYLSGDTTINNNLQLDNSGELECSTYSLIVNEATTLNQPSLLSKNSNAGEILFVGEVSLSGGDNKRVNFSGNPNIEFRGGLTINQAASANIWGSGSISFTTTNQTLFVLANLATFSASIVIVGAITLTINGGSSSTQGYLFQNTINGTTYESILVVKCYVEYQTSQQPMATGTLNCMFPSSKLVYNLNGDQTITSCTYTNLTLSEGGVKTLAGNVSVTDIYSLLSPATLNSNGFLLTNP
jgi:hypothetical protein